MINVPKCCSENPFGFIEVKVEDNITRISLCELHYVLHVEGYDDQVRIRTLRLEKNDQIPGITN